MIKLIATDMDGTFLKADQTYDYDHFEKLHQQMNDQGIRWVVASGNQYFQLKSYFKDYPDTIFVAENGAYIRDENEIYSLNYFEEDTFQKVLGIIQTIPDVRFLVCGQASAYTIDTNPQSYFDRLHCYYHELNWIHDYSELDDNILKFALACPPEKTEAIVLELQEKLGDLAEPTSSGHGDIDVIQPGMNKAKGLATLGKIVDVSLDEMAAFGDGGNDLEMLREVGLGVAMSNADPRVTALSDATTKDNEEQGVLSFLDTLLNEQKK